MFRFSMELTFKKSSQLINVYFLGFSLAVFLSLYLQVFPFLSERSRLVLFNFHKLVPSECCYLLEDSFL